MIEERQEKYTSFLYGEGGGECNFLSSLVSLKKFKDYYVKNWIFRISHFYGGDVKAILEGCLKEIQGFDYDLVICFVDLDKLKDDYKKSWKKEKQELEKKYIVFGINIFWQNDSLEDEQKNALGGKTKKLDSKKKKRKINKLAKNNIDKFINSEYWNRLIMLYKNKEKELRKNIPKI